MDISHQAVESRHFPISVGLRSQALKLNFVTPETPGLFLKPTLPFKNVMQIFERRFSKSLPNPVFHKAHIGETLSLIYSPFYIEDKIYDAVLNEPVTLELPDDFDTTLLSVARPDWRTHFVPTLCPGCGWDLYGQRDSLVLNCKNCNSVWRPAGNGFKRLKFACIPEKEDNIIYMPFWRIKTDISGIALNSYSDLAKVANLHASALQFPYRRCEDGRGKDQRDPDQHSRGPDFNFNSRKDRDSSGECPQGSAPLYPFPY